MRRLKALLILIILLFGGYLLFSSVDLRSPVRKEESSSLVFVPDGELEAQVTLFFPNQDYVISGNVELSRMLPVVRRVRIEENLCRYSSRTANHRRIGSSVPLCAMICKCSAPGDRINFILGFFQQESARGSLEETLLVEQIVKTMVGLDEIEQVQFLVDGEVRESLMELSGRKNPYLK